MVNDIAVQDFVNAIKETPTDTNTTYNATVSKIDNEGVVWVNLYGSDKETPTASTSTEVSSGDRVTVNWRNNKLYIGGNYSNPSAGMGTVNRVEGVATNAQAVAEIAYTAANSAVESAEVAASAAAAAQSSAVEAQASATTANRAANDALTQLSVVEEVVDVLNWVSEHGVYQKTNDTTVSSNKLYFTLTGTAVTPTTLADGTKLTNLESYYEKVNNVYVKTSDTTYNSSKTYYTVTATLVSNPTGNPKTQGYYEIASIDEAVQNYISSHLALTDSGLWVVKDNNGYKVLLANDGLKVYDNQGHLVSTFGESIVFDSARPQTIGNSSTYIKWYDTNNDGIADSIAIAGSNVNIASSVTIGGMPTKVSDLQNDSNFQTDTDVSSAVEAGTEAAIESANNSLNDFSSESKQAEAELEALIRKTAQDLSDFIDEYNLKIGDYDSFIGFNTETAGSPIMVMGAESSPFKMNLTNQMIQFVYDGTPIAFMSGDSLYVQQQISFGDFVMYQRANGHLTIKKITGGNNG